MKVGEKMYSNIKILMKISSKIKELLIQSESYDLDTIKIIFNYILGFPFIFPGGYIWNSQYYTYPSLIPPAGQDEFAFQYGTEWKTYRSQSETLTKPFDYYKELASEVIHFACQNNYSSISDMLCLFNLLAGFPYVMGHGFLWDGKYFDAPNEIPEQGRKFFCERYSSPNSLRIYA